eukprot:1199375-Amorphochlora_amoeboformis.AAC.1
MAMICSETDASHVVMLVLRWLFLRIETRKGIVGWGEPSLEGWCDSVMTCVGEMMESIVGEDPARIQLLPNLNPPVV